MIWSILEPEIAFLLAQRWDEVKVEELSALETCILTGIRPKQASISGIPRLL